jgi:hypothetical protein
MRSSKKERLMSAQTSEPDQQVTAPHHRSILWHWPALFALLIIGAIYTVISDQPLLGPRGLLLGLIIALMLPLGLSVHHGHIRLTRMLGFTLLGLVTGAEAISTSFLVLSLMGGALRLSDVPHDTAIRLLRDGALIWLVNILTFSLWYWEIDSGGPGRRLHTGYHSRDFAFPQVALDHLVDGPWCPGYVDYLFLAFNTSTAFSPTDTLVLSRRAKLLMMVQALISLAVLALLAARAINTL